MANVEPQNLFNRCVQRTGIALLLAGFGLPVGAETLYINKIAAYRNPDNVQEVVRQECRMDARIPEMVRDEIIKRAKYEDISLEDDPLGAKRPSALVV